MVDTAIPLLDVYSGETSQYDPGVVYKNVHCSIFHESYKLVITQILINRRKVSALFIQEVLYGSGNA